MTIESPFKKISREEWLKVPVVRLLADATYEMNGYLTHDDNLVGMVGRDRTDSDFTAVVFRRGANAEFPGMFTAVNLTCSHPSFEAAEKSLFNMLSEQWAS